MLHLIGVALVGAILGTAMDRLHLMYGVLSYYDITLMGQAKFVPVGMAIAAVALVFGHRTLVRLRGAMAASVGIGAGITYVVFLLIAFGATVFFQEHPKYLAIGLAVAFLPVIGSHPYNGFALLCVLAALIGTGVEIVMVKQEMFRYLHPDWQGVPMWLPSLYLWAAAAGAQADRYLHENIAVKKTRAGAATGRGTRRR